MIAQIQTGSHTLEEYLALEIASETRHEYIHGAIIPMNGGMPNHNRIIRNFCTLLTVRLPKDFEVFVSDQRLWIPTHQIYTYPDVMVIKGDLVLQEGRKDTITNPVLIVEVLSESTAYYDRGQKFAYYRSIPSFQEYLLVDQYTYSVQNYQKISDTKWEFEEFNNLKAEIEFTSIPCRISLMDTYEKVEL